jgi:hypothetical protein
MERFLLFPIIVLFPVLLIYLVLRYGSRMFGDFLRKPGGGPPRGGWLPGDPARGGSGLRSMGPARLQSMEARIFRLAFKRKGRVTVSDIVLETGMSVKEAEEAVNAAVDGVRVCMEVDDRGLVVYEFPEIIARFEGN